MNRLVASNTPPDRYGNVFENWDFLEQDTSDELRDMTRLYRQPATPEEAALAEEALAQCPTETIGNDGEK